MGSNQDKGTRQGSMGDDQDSQTRLPDLSKPTTHIGSHHPPLAKDKKKRRALKHSCASFPENNALSARLIPPT